MSTSIIIDARNRLSWQQRFAWEASTAALWAGWLWLWAPLVKTGVTFASIGFALPPWLPTLFPAGSPGSLPLSIVALAGTSGTLMALNKLPMRRQLADEVDDALPVSEYARHFQVPETVIEAGRSAAICVVHHDADGRIAGIECRDAAPAPAHAARAA
jgi:poly-beta-1,6-N-acetyl-D-glucosamine biosynthesis protein PgaD